MPLNICNKEGNHIGFLSRTYPDAPGIFMAALTDRRAEEFTMSADKLMQYLAGVYGTRNWRGKIDYEKLIYELEAQFGKGMMDDNVLLHYAFIKTAVERNDLHVFRHVDFELSEDTAKGYILVNLHNVDWDGNKIILNEDMDYISNEKACEGLPIYAKVLDYPVFYTDIMGFGEGFILGANWSDYGGRNHAHSTRLTIISGNVQKKIELPVFFQVVKDTPVQFYYKDEKIIKAFCGNAIYQWAADEYEPPDNENPLPPIIW